MFFDKNQSSRMDFYDISTAAAMSLSFVCIVWLYLLIKRDPQKTLFGRRVPSNLMRILIVLFVVAGVVAVVFKPATMQQPQYIAIEPNGKVTKIY